MFVRRRSGSLVRERAEELGGVLMQHTEQQFVLFSAILSDVEGDRVWMTCTCGAAINRNADRD